MEFWISPSGVLLEPQNEEYQVRFLASPSASEIVSLLFLKWDLPSGALWRLISPAASVLWEGERRGITH